MIRDVAKSDFAEVKCLLEGTSEFNSRDVACCLDCLSNYLEEAKSFYRFICTVNDSVIEGFACFDIDTLVDNVMEVYWLVVAPNKRNNGAGRLLLSHIESVARKQKSRMIILETESHSQYENARQLYKKCGFIQEAVINDFYQKGDNKEIYVKRIE